MEDLISRSYRPAYTLALRLLSDPEEAAEATQEAYVRMVRSLKGFREPAAFPTWLFRIVSNVCMTTMRKRSRRDIPTQFEPDQDPSPVDVEELAIDSLFREEVEACMRRLPELYRSVIVLRDVYDLPGDEVAGILGITPGAVKVRLHRARRKLRDELVERFPDWAAGPTEPRKASA